MKKTRWLSSITKKALALALSLCMAVPGAIAGTGMTVFADETGDGFTYEVTGEKGDAVKITKYSNPDNLTEITFPAEIDSKPVIEIDGVNQNRCVLNSGGNTTVTKVTIPNSVTKIGDGTFNNMSALKDIILSDNLTE